MRIAIITDDRSKTELLTQGIVNADELYWLDEPGPVEDCDCYIDLLYDASEERIKSLQALNASLILVNDVSREKSLPGPFVSFNGWNGFLGRPVVEVATNPGVSVETVEKVFAIFSKRTEWVPDQPGLITARVVVMIINEAYLTLGEGVSSRGEIDTAMKLGTNYPKGPFEWGSSIGIRNVFHLLTTLSANNPRYQPARLLEEEARS